MLRRVFTDLAAISLLLCVLIAVVWARSYFVTGRLYIEYVDALLVNITSHQGQLAFADNSDAVTSLFGEIQADNCETNFQPRFLSFNRFGIIAGSGVTWMGGHPANCIVGKILIVPDGFVFALFIALPIAWCFERRLRHRTQPGSFTAGPRRIDLKTLRRQLLNSFVAVSFLLCVISLAMWLTSQFRSEEFQIEHTRAYRLYTSQHQLFLSQTTLHATPDTVGYHVQSVQQVDAAYGWEMVIRHESARPQTWKKSFAFSFQSDSQKFGSNYPLMNSREIGMPWWAPVVLFAAAPVWWMWRRRRASKIDGRCVKCGYDLRATPTRCPECGTIAFP